MKQKTLKQKTQRLLSLLLAVIMLVTAQGVSVLADTVSQDDVQNVIAEEGAEEKLVQSVEDETGENIKIGEADEVLEAQPQAAIPENPVHHCVKDDTDWSYIYFGSYPQSEVRDEEIIAAIDSAIEARNAAEGAETVATDTERVETVGTDVEFDGTKYRRISEDDCNNIDYLNDMENNVYRYFKWEPIKWRVLDNNDDGTLFVMADKALDCKCYNNQNADITWENSTIRSWLNGGFYQTALSSEEQSAIKEWDVVTKGGNNTTDKVYLLSVEEVTSEKYGFCGGYSTSSLSRRLQISEYAHARGARRGTSSGYESNCWWWLRSPGRSSNAAYVNYYGSENRNGYDVFTNDGGAVPVLHINLSSELWLVACDEAAGERVDISANPVHHCAVKEDVTDWSYVYFGNYPQSEVTDQPTIAAIDIAIAEENAVVGDAGVDVWVNGTKYRRVSKDDTNYDGYFDYVKHNGYRYFKWERIKWRVLDNNDKGTLFVMADKALDCKNYHDYDGGDITWENSTIRNWLNSSFYQMAFSSAEKSAIEPWPVVNETPFWSTEGGNDTTDHVYLLSIGEVTNEKYGFCSDDSTDSPSRQLQINKYAHVRGASASGGDEGNCSWWLRSPGNDSGSAASVYGHVYRYGSYVRTINISVVPALHINLSSDLWLLTDDGTSGEGGGTSTGENQNPSNSQPEPSQPKNPQPTGTSLTASQVTSRTDTVPQGASFTVTDSDPANPTVSFDGVSNENASAVTIPKTITCNGVEYKVTSVSPKAFSTKKDNASFTVTDNRVESLTVEYKAPANAKKTKVTVPETTTYKGIKFKVTSVAAKSFKNNKKVKQVSVAGSVTKIGDSSFEGCTSLKSVTLGKDTSTIGKNAFKNCKKLTKITIKSTKLKTVGKNALKGVNAKCKIKVPAKQLKKYKNLFKKKGQKNSVKLVK